MHNLKLETEHAEKDKQIIRGMVPTDFRELFDYFERLRELDLIEEKGYNISPSLGGIISPP